MTGTVDRRGGKVRGKNFGPTRKRPRGQRVTARAVGRSDGGRAAAAALQIADRKSLKTRSATRSRGRSPVSRSNPPRRGHAEDDFSVYTTYRPVRVCVRVARVSVHFGPKCECVCACINVCICVCVYVCMYVFVYRNVFCAFLCVYVFHTMAWFALARCCYVLYNVI